MERLASVAQIGGFRPPSTPRTSWAGGVLLGQRGEEWPRNDEGPLWPILQLRVDELPAAPPGALDGVALLTFFCDLLDFPWDAPHGDGWEVRMYPDIDALVPIDVPEPREEIAVRAFPIAWHPRAETLEDHDELWGWKVGGHPIAIQTGTELEWGDDVEYVLQVETDEKTGVWFGDAGSAHLGYRAGGWVLSIENT
jgi:uncharacterized protein YwqG